LARRAVQYVHQDAGAALDPWWSIGRILEEGLIVLGLGSLVLAIIATIKASDGLCYRYPLTLRLVP